MIPLMKKACWGASLLPFTIMPMFKMRQLPLQKSSLLCEQLSTFKNGTLYAIPANMIHVEV
jgi:hypothetical protein